MAETKPIWKRVHGPDRTVRRYEYRCGNSELGSVHRTPLDNYHAFSRRTDEFFQTLAEAKRWVEKQELEQ